MKDFIEVSEGYSHPAFVNIDNIQFICPSESSMGACYIKLIDCEIRTKETYKEVKQKIEVAKHDNLVCID